MRFPLHLVTLATLLLPGSASLAAQIHSPQVTVHRKAKPEDLTWLWAFAQPEPEGRENDLANDPRFRTLLRSSFIAPQSFWGKDKSLAEAAQAFLGGPPGSVIADENRYLSADACVQHFCPDRGLLWIDLGLPHPLLVFTAIDWISENKTTAQSDSTYSMWVFSNRPLDRAHLPPALRHSIARWTAQPSSGSSDLQNITRVFIVDPDGTPHPFSPATIGAHNALPPETVSEASPNPKAPS